MNALIILAIVAVCLIMIASVGSRYHHHAVITTTQHQHQHISTVFGMAPHHADPAGIRRGT
jgi:hypothetical protein